ncbi:SCO family protein [Geminicoccus roseus]|uniref:SCO family protein n=1 Tax=Geminicoccus roseus TaxID=404900 RepID=UPI0003FB86C3|nr:SCO family protein [Geminicoccus roseus]
MRAAILRSAAVVVLAAGTAGLVGWQAGWFEAARTPAPQIPGVIREAPVGGPFTLTSHDGRTVTEKDLQGKLTLMFFGYRFCPDFCPNELQKYTEVLEQLGPQADKVQAWFVSIDPERDRPEDLAEYVDLFDPRIVGLSGSKEQVSGISKAWRVYYARAEQDESTDYLMDHSTYSYLMGPDGTNLAVFNYEVAPETMVKVIEDELPAG